MADSPPTYLSPSELGSKDYWDKYYARTLAHLSQSQPHNPSSTTTNTTPNAPSTENDDSSDNASEVNDDDDPGTSWFSEHNAPQKVLRFLTSKSFPLSPRNSLRRRGHSSSPSLPRQPSILDLGTGNGSMLALLRKKGGFVGEMVGVDYSARSVQLARELQSGKGHSAYHTDDEDGSDESDEDDDEGEDEEGGEDQGPYAAAKEEVVLASPEPGKEATEAVRISEDTDENQTPEIRFEEWDILGSTARLSETGTPSSEPPPADQRLDWFPYETGGFDIVLDKGTFDAVSLSDDAKDTRVCERYPRIARRLVRAGGFVVVTSCNWTEEELVSWFVGSSHDQEGNDRLVVWGRVEYPRFRFGGHEGQGVSTVCFQRVAQ
ncbi:hypothetical protein N7474_009395 [Penicillium riverlandense]|uniref:uncharacterized protein n=1 Tax=Penicillium riverlandense TaxID=1903569 RepID=UPI002548CA44|nr:uncharacterized protein N7474_009395 [Penicillium riverlandense]KAJ5808126.1 hypothetical protein N7474_009395 [Penicillium riverlandense]